MTYAERSGVLLIADISGYTEYLAADELSHAEGIISRLLEAAIVGAGGGLDATKLEGDAIFFLGDETKITPQTLRAAVTEMFARFHACRRDVTSMNTCHCRGCATAARLGLKFVAHYGRFGEHSIHGMREVIGQEVILVHRLLKNNIGLREYAAFTSALVDRWGSVPPGGTRHQESYEHIGDVELWVWNLEGSAP